MIWGRPANLIVSAFGLLFNAVVVGLGTANIHIPGELVASINAAFAGVVAFIAYQPPTVNPGDDIKVTTPAGQPTATITAPTPGD